MFNSYYKFYLCIVDDRALKYTNTLRLSLHIVLQLAPSQLTTKYCISMHITVLEVDICVQECSFSV